MKEIKKIRIGNDIRLAVDLSQYLVNSYNSEYLRERKVYNPNESDFENIDDNIFVNKHYEVYYPNQYSNTSPGNGDEDEYIDFKPSNTPISIRSIKAYLINTSKIEERLAFMKNRKNFITRYPVEPYANVFDSTAYDICGCGAPTWNFRPFPHRIVPYGGFGVNPRFGGIYKSVRGHDDLRYCAQTYATSKQNVVEVSFPAYALKYTGKYKLIIIAKIYAPGFNDKNLKTITVDMSDVFELVDTTEKGVNTGISMNVNIVQDILPSGEEMPEFVYDDIYLDKAEFDENMNTINLERSDGEQFVINLDDRLGWYYGD